MGIPAVPLGQLYGAGAWERLPNVRFHLRSRSSASMVPVSPWPANSTPPITTSARCHSSVFPRRATGPALDHSPITGVHLWFDREVTTLPMPPARRTMQWMFNKDRGRYLQLVVSASRDLTNVPRQEIVDIAIGELRLYFPRVLEPTW